MDDYEQDEVLKDIHDEMYVERQQNTKNSFNNISDTTKIIIGSIGLVIGLLMIANKISVKVGLLIIGGLFVYILFLNNATNKQPKELSMIECMIRVNDQLTFIQQHPIGNWRNIPKGKIKIDIIGRKQWFEGLGFKRSFKVTIHDHKKEFNRIYFVECDIYTGDIITVKYSPQGVYGDETKDLKYLPTPMDRMNSIRDKYVGKGGKK